MEHLTSKKPTPTVCKSVLVGLLLALGICSTIGCSEDTTGPGDEPEAAPEHIWSMRCGDGSTQYGRAVAVDGAGNTLLAGEFEGTVDCGGGALTSAGTVDILVAKFASDGTHLWSKRFGDATQQFVRGIAVDVSGNVIVAGWFLGTIDFGGGALTSAGNYDMFLAKLGPDGAQVWSHRFGNSQAQTVSAVASDASGNVIVTGSSSGTIDFGGGALTSAGVSDIVVAKFGPDGAHLWSQRFGDASHQEARALAVDPVGNVVLAGEFEGTVDFGGGALTSAGNSDIFVAKFGPDGTHAWSKRFGDEQLQRPEAVAVDASGNVLVTGVLGGSADFGGGALTSAGYSDIFVAKFGPDGTHAWSKRFGDEEVQTLGHWGAITTDYMGDVLVTGLFFGTVDLGGGPLTAGLYNADIFVAKFGPDGAHLWSQRFGDAYTQGARAIAVDPVGNVVLAGTFEGTVDFGGGSLSSAGSWDIFVAKLGP